MRFLVNHVLCVDAYYCDLSLGAPFRPSTSVFSSLVHVGYLRATGPLHLRMVIQVLLNACVHRLHP